MKKFVSVLVASMLSMVVLVGCGKDDEVVNFEYQDPQQDVALNESEFREEYGVNELDAAENALYPLLEETAMEAGVEFQLLREEETNTLIIHMPLPAEALTGDWSGVATTWEEATAMCKLYLETEGISSNVRFVISDYEGNIFMSITNGELD